MLSLWLYAQQQEKAFKKLNARQTEILFQFLKNSCSLMVESNLTSSGNQEHKIG